MTNLEARRAAQARYRAANAEKIAQARKAYKAAHRDQVKAEKAHYKAAHPETVKAAKARYRAAHVTEIAAARTDRKKSHPEEVKAEKIRYRATLPVKRIRRHTFAAIDGEGWTSPEGRHAYTMIVTSIPGLDLYTGRPLSSVHCLGFLADLPLERDRRWVSFYFDYDTTMILRDMAIESPEKARQLFTPGRKKYVWWRGFGIRYRPHKQLMVKRWTADRSSKARTIHDVQGFYQSSFVAALERFGIGTPEERAELARMKDQRADFDPTRWREIRDYSRQECRHLVDLVGKLRDLCADVNLNPHPYEGPGSLASRAMERHYGKARHAEAIAVASSRVGDAASCAMYGGRFETTAVGSVIGDVTEYDLNSAYPAAMRDLPCLVHGRWARTRTNHGPIAVSHLTFRHDTPDGPGVCHPLPVRRRTGELFYPREGRGWYWRAEYDRPGLDVTADVTYSWRPDGCACRPFAWVADYYDRRKELDAATPGSGIPLKLTLNTLYGKNAQTRPEPGPWLNMVHASIITATVRRRMFDLYEALPPRSVVMFATDAIFVHAPHTLPTSDGLGGLAEEHTYRELVIVQPGVYFDADAAHFKSRGMPRKVMAEHAVGLSVAAMMGSPYTLAHTVFVGVRVALALGRPEDAGQWIRPHREIATRTTSKRIGGTWVDDGSGAVCWTDPAPPLLDASGGLQESYWRQFAMAAREEAALADLWSDDLPTWDE